jgi:hypothetical protein
MVRSVVEHTENSPRGMTMKSWFAEASVHALGRFGI